ncbi:AraC family transcriptional regulator [Rhizobium sp. Root1220]|uniref:AraC family transcriptional regulator n=1 Tax=Rhizobium sp. Root1220 TaxID=1736432 RepID=UPI000701FCF8|nr:AraC family transcriptional regulator [Rhizobium sp. Root1220]KQV65342.1 AraC family transcriptional regulator [Rhizobium sp. Root1220]
MDVLSRLIDLSRLQPSLDIRCKLRGTFQIEHDIVEGGTIPFHLVLGGQCIIRTGAGRQVTMKSGDFLMFPRGEAHAIVGAHPHGRAAPLEVTVDGMLPLRRNGDGDPDVDLLCGHFTSASATSTLLLDTLPDVFHASLSNAQSEQTLRTMVSLLRQETALELPGALTVVTAMCLALFVMAVRTTGNSPLEVPGLLPLLTDPRLGKSVRSIVAAPSHPWTIDDLARLSAMSRATYARRFRDRSGFTVGAFLTDFRMSMASDLLLQTHRSVADIAVAVGYESEAAFAKAFKTKRELTPSRFRRAQSDMGSDV